MEKPVKGSIVVIPFPFSDLSNTKRRPALVVAQLTPETMTSIIDTTVRLLRL